MTNDFLKLMPSHILSAVKEIDLNIKSKNCRAAINDLLQNTVLMGGKRLRPLLTHLVGELFKLPVEVVSPYAKAVELVHAASLSHDDVIDNATLRRGAPSINIVASNKRAVLAGDTLLSSVIVELCEAGNLELVKEMSRVIQDLSDGEWLQSDLILSRDYTDGFIREVALKKTSSVMSYCCVAPAILAKMPEDIVLKAREIGIRLGLAFQMIDDTLDYNENSMKDQMLDLQNGIVNTVLFHYLNSHEKLLQRFKNGEDLSSLIELKDLSVSIETVKKSAHLELEKANLLLNEIFEFLKINRPELNLKKEDLIPLETVISFMALRSI